MTLAIIIVGLSCGMLGFYLGHVYGTRVTDKVMKELHDLRRSQNPNG